MKFRTLIFRSLRFHWRSHLGVLLGAAVGSAALIGALVVGDSVRESLRELALQRLGDIAFAVAPHDRFFRDALWHSVQYAPLLAAASAAPAGTNVAAPAGLSTRPNQSTAPVRRLEATITTGINLPGTASREDGSARANRVQVLSLGPGLDQFAAMPGLTNFASDSVLLNQALAAQLNARPGDSILLRVRKPSALAREAPIAPQSDSTRALRLRVHSILPADKLGNFNLSASQLPPLNAFVRADTLQNTLDLAGRANLLLTSSVWQSLPPQARPRYVEAIVNAWRIFSERINRKVRWRTVHGNFEPVPTPEALAFLSGALHAEWQLADAELELRYLPESNAVELRSPRIFLEPPVVAAALHSDRTPGRAQGILTYLVNQLRAGSRATPYSMVTAMGAPVVPADMRDDEILINQWLADDLQIGPGAEISLTYFLPESGSNLVEATNHFRVRAVLPMSGPSFDPTLMPEFPGLAKAETTHDWDAGFPLVHKIRDQDDKYWKDYRGTPKAFVTLASGKKMWANRFGELTAVRFPIPPNTHPGSYEDSIRANVLQNLNPADIGLTFQPVREQAVAASSQEQDFAGLFLGFSFFLILAALILMALLFQFGVEERIAEVGTLLALGFTPGRVRWLLLGEGTAIALLGGVLGALGGLGYARTLLQALTTIWRDAVGTSALRFHATLPTLLLGMLASVIVCVVTIGFVLRRQVRRPTRELLGGFADFKFQISNLKSRPGRARWIAAGGTCAALALIGWAVFTGQNASAEVFFGAGALLLVSGLAAVAVLLTALGRSEAGQRLTLGALGIRSCTRRRTRSLASVALLACGSFLVVAVGANRLDAGRDATRRSSGTGGFALFGESTLPVVRDLNTKSGRESFGLDEQIMQGVSIVPFRVRDGDDASCLNLNRAQTPRLLGVKPEPLAQRGAFTFSKVLAGLPGDHPWSLLDRRLGSLRESAGVTPEHGDAIPAVGDAASIQWALGKKLGDTLTYTDEQGQSFQVRLVGAVANSILQGNLVIDEAEFVKRFPSESGYRMFLIDTPSKNGATLAKLSSALSRALQDVGLELTPAARRLAAFNAVQNTYLNTFQVLGGLGLLLGSAGLGVVVLRNVLERRAELGLLQAVGFRRRSLQWLVLSEHGGLLAVGLGVGLTAALAAILPVLLAPGAQVHYLALGATLMGVWLSGLLWTWWATRWALRAELLKALRNE